MSSVMTLKRYPSQGGAAFGKIGARRMMNSWKNPYVIDGLVQHYDAIWNYGYGVHDASARTLFDLSGNGNIGQLTQYATVGSDSILVDGVSGYGISFNGYITPIYTLEVVAKMTSWQNAPRLTAEVPYPSIYFGTSNDSVADIAFYGQTIDTRFGVYINRTVRFSVAVTYDGTYIVADNNGNRGQLTNNNAPTSVATATMANRPTGSRGFNGEICAFRRYNRPLTADEIAHNYAIDKARFNIP